MSYLALLVFLFSVQTFSSEGRYFNQAEVCFLGPSTFYDDNPEWPVFEQEESDFEGPYNHRTEMDDVVALCSEAMGTFCRFLFRLN